MDPLLPHLVSNVLDRTFVPPGFDSNDRAQVLIVPYPETAELGVLRAGTCQIISLDEEGKEHVTGPLPVAPAPQAFETRVRLLNFD